MVSANLIVATGHNSLAIARGVEQVAKRFVNGRQLEEGALNRVSALVRAYDPCLSCSTPRAGHDAGEAPPRRPGRRAAGRETAGLAARRRLDPATWH